MLTVKEIIMATKAERPAKPTLPSDGNTQKDPEQWVTGQEPMTGAQKSYLKTLSEEAGVEPDESLTKGEASEQISELKDKQHVVDHRADGSTSNTEKDPADWATGDEPMTGAQKSYLKTLSDEAGAGFDETLTKGEASKKIEELRQNNPRTN
ncbi:MAG: hypothetical protein JWM57_2120 [Phycisphaerales bacterium]|nr:hypothetical protein [Phycisphaerales bacterium]